MLIWGEFDKNLIINYIIKNNNQIDVPHTLNYKFKLEATLPKGHLKFSSDCLNKVKEPKTNLFRTA